MVQQYRKKRLDDGMTDEENYTIDHTNYTHNEVDQDNYSRYYERQQSHDREEYNRDTTTTTSVLEGWEDLLKPNDSHDSNNNNNNDHQYSNSFKDDDEELSSHGQTAYVQEIKDLFMKKYGMQLPDIRQASTATTPTTTTDTKREGEHQINKTTIHNQEQHVQEMAPPSLSSSFLPPEIKHSDFLKMILTAEQQKQQQRSSRSSSSSLTASSAPSEMMNVTKEMIASTTTAPVMIPMATIEETKCDDSSLNKDVDAKNSSETNEKELCLSNNASNNVASSSSLSSSSSVPPKNPLLESMPPHIRDIALRRPDLVSHFLSRNNVQGG
eukprot:15356315-Ditylum_brightwellii.AAC.1